MNHILFSEKMKLADLIHANYKLLYALPRFDIQLGLGDYTVRQVCEQKRISVPLFLLVCNIYTFDEYIPDNKALEQIPLSELISYLRNSHKDYLSSRVPQITDKILDLVNCCHIEHGKILEQFFEKYRGEIILHFNYEEEVVFPYIFNLLNGNDTGGYKIEEFEGNHTNIEEALTDLKNIIIKYMPSGCTIEKIRSVLVDLFLLEDDLNKHTLLEDEILVSLVEHIEKNKK